MDSSWCRRLILFLATLIQIIKFTKNPLCTPCSSLMQYFFVYAFADGQWMWDSDQGINWSMKKVSMMHYWVITKTTVWITAPERNQGRQIDCTRCLMILITDWCPSIHLSCGFVGNKPVKHFLLSISEFWWIHIGRY